MVSEICHRSCSIQMEDSLESLLESLQERIIPSAYEKKVEISRTLEKEQRKIALLGREYYHLLYKFEVLNDSSQLITFDEYTSKISLLPTYYIPNIDPLPAQVLINTLKLLFQQPRLFALSLIESNMPEKEFISFAYMTFPALFGFFTSQDFCEPAGLLILDLIQAGGPDYMIFHLVLSFLYSSINFIESMWCQFSRICIQVSPIKPKNVHESLLTAIKSCIPLIPASIFFICRELTISEIELLFDIIFLNFLPKTFKVWVSRSALGLSFANPHLVTEYFAKNATWPNENAVCIINQITKNVPRLPKVPNFPTICRLNSSLMIFNNRDIIAIFKAFKSMTQKIQLFDALEGIGKDLYDNGFEPFMIQFFHRASPARSRSIDIIPIPKINIDFTPNTVLEKAYVQYAADIAKGLDDRTIHPFFKSKEFLDYKLLKDISLLNVRADDQNDVLRLTIAKEEVLAYENSLKSILNDLLGFIFFETRIKKIAALTISSVFNLGEIVEYQSSGKEQLRVIVTEELLNTFSFESIIPINRKLIEKISTTISSTREPSDQLFSQSVPLSSLALMITNRQNLKAGQFLKLVTCIVDNAVAFTRPPSKFAAYSPEDVIRYVIRMSAKERDICAFIFLEKIFLRSNFIRKLPQKLINSCNMFVQSMWELIGTDQSTLQLMLSYEIPNV